MRLKETINKLRGAEKALRVRGVMHLCLFGSVARDEASNTSDVDVFIDRDPKRPFGMVELSGVHLLLEDVLGSPVDVGTRRGLHPTIRAQVEKTAIQVF